MKHPYQKEEGNRSAVAIIGGLSFDIEVPYESAGEIYGPDKPLHDSIDLLECVILDFNRTRGLGLQSRMLDQQAPILYALLGSCNGYLALDDSIETAAWPLTEVKKYIRTSHDDLLLCIKSALVSSNGTACSGHYQGFWSLMALQAVSSGGIENADVADIGLTQVYAPTGGGNVDIVFVHGLNGHPKKTWTAEKSNIFWPLQLLPPILTEQKSRILVYGYDASVASFTDGVSKDKIHNHAETLVAGLSANRRIRNASERPIIFVAHSLGGLVVKRALIHSNGIRGDNTAHLRSVFVSTFGILFLGTPHRGSDIAKWGSLLESVCRGVMSSGIVDSEPGLVNALKRENETLQVIDREFYQLLSRFHVYFFHEGKKTNLGRMKMAMVVDEESASPNAQDVERAVIQQDHAHMCKFENDGAPGFDLVVDALLRYSEQAPGVIAINWQQEQAERLTQKKYWLEQNVPDALKASIRTDSSTQSPPSTVSSSQLTLSKDSPRPDVTDNATNTPASPSSSQSPEPYFVVPPGFRPNSFFVGMEKELLQLDQHLFDRKRRSMGTACVLLHGQPGGGKTHMARQYVNKNRKKFPGGIFWISSKSREELCHSFSIIKQRIVARDAPELCNWEDGCDVSRPVKAWFERRQEWLIVFDGVRMDKNEDATELSGFVPDKRNSSLIYISRAKNLESKQRLLRPFPIKVGPLKDDEAKKLLFKMLRISKPTNQEKRKASELVNQVGGLPMAIDAISHRLSDTHEPLARFKLSFPNSPGLESTYNQILDDLQRLDHMEAWNLINILCWFGQDIPAEMVRLGLRIFRRLGVEVRAREDSSERDINNTFSILMRYALIERNEPESDKGSFNSSHDSLIEPEPIDMLKIHSVVQSFCCDSLNARQMLPQWLHYAIRLFSASFYQADIKIKSKSAAARVSDYRYYLVHGQKLWENIETYESSKQHLTDLRDTLAPVLATIKEEIRKREPNSSQEGFNKGVFQISIFDRTSSSSDSVPDARTPEYHPTPTPLGDQSIYGMPVDKALESPASFDTVSPGLRPRVVGLSPNTRPLGYEDAGYESDREGHRMQRNASENTTRARSHPRAPTKESQTSGWELVPPARKTKRRAYRDLGSFRPTPVKAQLSSQSVQGQMDVLAGGSTHTRRASSPAQEALKEVQNHAPSSSSAGGVASFFHRNPFSRTTTENGKPSGASIAAGLKPSKTTTAATGQKQSSPPAAPFIIAGGKATMDRNRRKSVPSPLGKEFVPRRELDVHNQRMNGDFTLYHSDDQEATPTVPRPPAPYTTEYAPIQQQAQQALPIPSQPAPLGANQAPLAIDNHISITSTRPPPPPANATNSAYLPAGPTTPDLSQSLPSFPNQRQPPFYYPAPTHAVSGYTSQPMSRGASHQSHGSTAETEPPPYPAYSPYTFTIPPATAPAPSLPFPSRPSNADFRTSRLPSRRPRTPSYINAAASSGSPSPTFPPAQMPLYLVPLSPSQTHNGRRYSRESNGGPGLAVDGASGLGIVGFSDGLQFGAHDPLSVEEGRERVREEAGGKRASAPPVELRNVPPSQLGSSRGGGGTEARVSAVDNARENDGRAAALMHRVSSRGAENKAPEKSKTYPDINLIPTSSDTNALQGMLNERRESPYPDRNLIPTSSDAGTLMRMVDDSGDGGFPPPPPPLGEGRSGR